MLYFFYVTKYPLIKQKKNKNHYCKYGHFTNTFIPYDIDKFYYQQNALDINWDTNQKYAYMLKNPQIYIIHVNSMRILYYLGVLSDYNNVSSSTTDYITINDLKPPYKLKWHKVWSERLIEILIKHNFKDKKLQWVFGDIEIIQMSKT